MESKKHYKPLPNYLAIGPSDIDGAGIFAREDIPSDIEIGITHVYDPDFENDHIRTPLGGFLNHSLNPNCELKNNEAEDKKILYTKRKIGMGEELTVTYTWYSPEE